MLNYIANYKITINNLLTKLPCRCESSNYRVMIFNSNDKLFVILSFLKHMTVKTKFYFKTEIGNVFLFNDALNTFYLRLYGITHMVKDHSDSERGNPLPPHRLLFPISCKGSFICILQTG